MGLSCCSSIRPRSHIGSAGTVARKCSTIIGITRRAQFKLFCCNGCSWRASFSDPLITRWNSLQPHPLNHFAGTGARSIPAALLGGKYVFRLDAKGLGKGMVWGQWQDDWTYWLVEARQPSEEPTQRYHHIPADWLKETNEVIFFEEQAALPTSMRLQCRA